MSDYCEFGFTVSEYMESDSIVAKARTLFDAVGIDDGEYIGRNGTDLWYFKLCISELSLRECLPIIEELQKEFHIPFVVEYGVIYES